MSISTAAMRKDGAVHERYDPASKVWTSLCAAVIAALVDWFAVVIPVDGQSSGSTHSVYWGWWTVALVLAVLPSLAWTIGHGYRRNYEAMVLWLAGTLLVAMLQFVVLKWATS